MSEQEIGNISQLEIRGLSAFEVIIDSHEAGEESRVVMKGAESGAISIAESGTTLRVEGKGSNRPRSTSIVVAGTHFSGNGLGAAAPPPSAEPFHFAVGGSDRVKIELRLEPGSVIDLHAAGRELRVTAPLAPSKRSAVSSEQADARRMADEMRERMQGAAQSMIEEASRRLRER